MASDPSYALQLAFRAVLTGADFQQACGVAVGVYDFVPPSAKAPYITISDIQVDGADTSEHYDGSEVYAALVVWSSKPGKVELGRIADQVRTFLAPRAALGPPFDLSANGHSLITWKFQQTVPLNDPDGITVKATVKILYRTQPLT